MSNNFLITGGTGFLSTNIICYSDNNDNLNLTYHEKLPVFNDYNSNQQFNSNQTCQQSYCKTCKQNIKRQI